MKHRILVIDDDPAVTSLLKRGLSYEGFAVDTAKSGVEEATGTWGTTGGGRFRST